MMPKKKMLTPCDGIEPYRKSSDFKELIKKFSTESIRKIVLKEITRKKHRPPLSSYSRKINISGAYQVSDNVAIEWVGSNKSQHLSILAMQQVKHRLQKEIGVSHEHTRHITDTVSSIYTHHYQALYLQPQIAIRRTIVQITPSLITLFGETMGLEIIELLHTTLSNIEDEL